jgi:hypothetical protein
MIVFDEFDRLGRTRLRPISNYHPGKPKKTTNKIRIFRALPRNSIRHIPNMKQEL